MTPALNDHSSNLTPRPFVDWCVRYFEALATPDARDHWQRGLNTAREWLRLINAPSVSPKEVSSLVGIAQANQRRGSGWNVMAMGIHSWAAECGCTEPSFEEFYDRREWAREALDKHVSAAHAADILFEHFQRRTHQDPDQEIWDLGLNTARTWRDLIHRDSVPGLERAALLESARRNAKRHETEDWWVLEQAIDRWSKESRSAWRIASPRVH